MSLVPREWLRRHHPYKPLYYRPPGRVSPRAQAASAFATGLISAAANNPGVLRTFVNANPPWAGPAVRNALRMGGHGSLSSTKRRLPSLRGKRYRRRRTRRRTRRRKVCRPIIRRYLKQFDGSESTETLLKYRLDPKGGSYKYIPSVNGLPLLAMVEQYGREYTHFKVLRWRITYSPETRSHPTLDEVAKNGYKSLPSMFRSYHIGSVAPTSVKNLLATSSAMPIDPLNVHHFSLVPKYIRKMNSALQYEIKPKNYWLPLLATTDISPMNGPVIAWSKYVLPNDPKPLTPTYSIRFKWIVKATIKLAKFSSFTDKSIEIGELFEKPTSTSTIGSSE
ncbi:Cap [Eumops bonariensis associated cyclovirus 1]|uniref:Cap n=1 Tax=Eumops bonariensis associated cyclovirus 1 TaxID=2911958 RepID=UPI0024819FD3|nr:Cap [Eumops bonariensis associated cyclovirus 1]UJO02086.1 Cap [Eumops bonariensis associated cyclovirus 1]